MHWTNPRAMELMNCSQILLIEDIYHSIGVDSEDFLTINSIVEHSCGQSELLSVLESEEEFM